MTIRELSAVCCDRSAKPAKLRARIEALLKAGADIQETDKNGVTPLHHAVRFRNVTAVETLLKNGANVNQVCKRSGATALHRAVLSTGAPRTAGTAAEAARIIELLLEAGADVAIRNKLGKRAIDYVRDEGLRQTLERAAPGTRSKRGLVRKTASV